MLFLVLAVHISFAQAPAVEAAGPATSMVTRLAALRDSADPSQNPVMNQARARMIKQHLDATEDFASQMRLNMQLGYELLLAGATEEAIARFEKVREIFELPHIRPDATSQEQVRDFLTVCYLRLGEQDNCVAHHTSDSCLMPIGKGGIHHNDRGSRKAIEELSAALRDAPDDLRARWLLNLAHMTLGEYPEKVPEPWRIAPQRFDSDYPLPRFVDVAPRAGLDLLGLSGGVILEDFDGDGHLDVMASSWGLADQLQLMHNDGSGSFTERTAAAGLTGQLGGLNLSQADFDNDGDVDVLVLRGAWLRKQGHHPNSLLRNNGDGTFTDVTAESGTLCFSPTQTAGWADYDGDGWVDLFIGNESSSEDIHACQLFRNLGNGTFRNVADDVGLNVIGFVKGVAWGDFNNDGRPDIYLSRLGQPNLLYRNDGRSADGNWRFTEVSQSAGVNGPTHSFPTWFFDFNNDGWEDLFVATYSAFGAGTVDKVAADYLGLPTGLEHSRLYINQQDGTFADASQSAGLDDVLLAMGANFGDLDNDGFLDCYFGTGEPDLATLVPNRMYRNAGGRTLQDVTTAGGFGHLQKGHGIAFGDIDNDGDQDIYAVMGGAYSGDVFQNVLFQNPGNANHWITLILEGRSANRAAIGARIRVGVATASGTRNIFVTAGSGGSFGASSLRQEIGLGEASKILDVEIRWPGQSVQTLRDVPMDRIVKVREGESQFTIVPLPRIQLP